MHLDQFSWFPCSYEIVLFFMIYVFFAKLVSDPVMLDLLHDEMFIL